MLQGEERVTLILLETVDNIQQISTIHIGTDVKDTICLKTVTWLNPFNATFTVPSNSAVILLFH